MSPKPSPEPAVAPTSAAPLPSGASDVPPALAAIEADLLAPGGLFELEETDVGGERMAVMKNRMRSLREALAGSVAHGDREYVVFGDGRTMRSIGYAEHVRLVASTAAALSAEYGVGPGDRVAILAANCPEWIITFWATVSLGAVAVGLNGWWVGPEIRYGLADCEPKLLVADRRRRERLGAGDAGVPTIIVEDSFADLTTYAPDAVLPDTPIAEDDPAVILYTSGTTGRPKGAVNTHRNIVAAVGLSFFHGLRMQMWNPPDASAPPSRQLVTYPLFHVSGLHMGAVAFLVGGVPSVWVMGRFDPAVVLGLIEQQKVTHWSFTPTMLHRVVHHPDLERYDLSSWVSGGGGGAFFSPALQRAVTEKLPRLRTRFGVGYGQTECAALATLNSGEELIAHPSSVGRPLPTVQIEIRDAFGRALPEGETGEIHVRGPMVMPGYWRRPDADEATILSGHWLRTGDLGYMDAGRLYLASRRPDLILRGGENVYPAEIEQFLEEHPGVAEVAVIGVDHEELGQEVMAVVVPEAGRVLEADELRDFCARGLAYFKVPSRWEIRTVPLPRNAGGKVVKAALFDARENTFVEE